MNPTTPISSPAPVELTGPITIDFHLPDAIDALNAYRQAQHLVAGISEASTPPDLAQRILAVYADAAHELASHVSAAVSVQRGEPNL
jgi:hypothetical protein